MDQIVAIPENIRHLLAAAEIVERPSSIVKELIDNSIDAGATRIEIDTQDGGQTRVCVTDDGRGIPSSSASLATQSHYSSKVSDLECVFNPKTKGFRGEALHAIDTVTRLSIVSRHASDPFRYTLQNGELRPVAGRNIGTVVTVEDLFSNIPARRSHLKSVRSDKSHNNALIRRLAVIHNSIAFKFTSDKDKILETDGQSSRLKLLQQYIKKNIDHYEFFAEQLSFKMDGDEWCVDLVISERKEGASRSFGSVNGFIFDTRILESAIESAYKNVWQIGNKKFDVFAFAQADHKTKVVDYNCHPRKNNVEFKNIHKFSSALKEALCSAMTEDQVVENTGALDMRVDVGSTQSANHQYLGIPIGQYKAGIILSQSPEGLILIDQHAAHEKLVMSRMLRDLEAVKLPTRKLMSPVFLCDDLGTMFAIETAQEQLNDAGYHVDLTDSEVLITHVPDISGMTSRKIDDKDHAKIVLDFMASGDRSVLCIYRDIANRACKQAIKFGKVLSLKEQDDFLREMERCPESLTCNHGRPTTRLIDHDKLLAFFERV